MGIEIGTAGGRRRRVLVFKQPPRLGFGLSAEHRPEPDQLVIRIDPSAAIRLRLEARRADSPSPEPITLDMEFADEGGEGASPYEVLLAAAMAGDSMRFARQEGVEQRLHDPPLLLDAPPPVQSYEPGTAGPAAADALAEPHGGWRGPWTAT